ncbi:hypothetical protein V1511DRAFT_521240 [Dipodascopsis uninucleata]
MEGAGSFQPASASPIPAPTHTQVPPPLHRNHTTTKRKSLGDWDLLKTIGAGSMGKVKLARHRRTGELAAVKIIPRYVPEGQMIHHHRRNSVVNKGDVQNKSSSDESKEIRTIREAAIVSLLDHRYICGVREVMVMTHHYYMIMEYVNGGQMLDYIISHGRLKEKQARKFARQIASALDYCHHNSVVHRDLKIENILIAKSGDIKIIDFGLSNIYSPRSLLHTFCGSLYFAAPELLNAKQYIGPEVDIWSFGIVLYVLACGKVPFDDQSMPALHAKIKRGHVEYPSWLSTECKNLLSRMLVVDPKARATLPEIINHPWMLKGYDGPQNSYIPLRKPLTLPLDMEVIKGMHGFEFGTDEEILADLTAIIESPEYQAASLAWYRNETYNQTVHNHFSGISSLFDSSNSNAASVHSGSTKKRSAFPFDFYKRRQSNASSSSSQETLTDITNGKLPDPTNAYHPLTSIYYLAREKQERMRRRPTLEAPNIVPRAIATAGGTTIGPAYEAITSPPATAPNPTYYSSSAPASAVPTTNLPVPVPKNSNVPQIPSSAAFTTEKVAAGSNQLEVPVIPMPETAHTHAFPIRNIFPGRSRSVNHGHSGYMRERSGSNLSGSPTEPVTPIVTAPKSQSSHHSRPSTSTDTGAVLELPPMPIEMEADENGRIQVGDSKSSEYTSQSQSSTASSGRRDGISLGSLLRRISTRRGHRSGNTNVAGTVIPPLSTNIVNPSSNHQPPPSPSAFSPASASFEDDRVRRASADMRDLANDSILASPDTPITPQYSVTFNDRVPDNIHRHMGNAQNSSTANSTGQQSSSNQNHSGAPQSFIRFERLFSRASNFGRSTSISEGTYNRRISRSYITCF